MSISEGSMAYIVKSLEGQGIKYDQMKIHKILYFAKAKALSEGEDLFDDIQFEAWRNGPVIANERNDIVHNFFGIISDYANYYENKIDELSESQKKVLNDTIKIFGGFKAYQLSSITHKDVFKINEKKKTPWQIANNNQDYSKVIIPSDLIKEFYTKEWFEAIERNKEILMRNI